jgi:hypothetical protein
VVACAYNHSFVGGRDWEDGDSKPAQAYSWKEPHL